VEGKKKMQTNTQSTTRMRLVLLDMEGSPDALVAALRGAMNGELGNHGDGLAGRIWEPTRRWRKNLPLIYRRANGVSWD
jgi:hypothetical protein